MAVRMDDTELPIVREAGGGKLQKLGGPIWPPVAGDLLLENGERFAVTAIEPRGFSDGRDRIGVHLEDGRVIEAWQRHGGLTVLENYGTPLHNGDWLVTFEGTNGDERWRVSKSDVHDRAGREIYDRSDRGQRVLPDSAADERARLERAAISVATEARTKATTNPS